jgi:hypothetical protein
MKPNLNLSIVWGLVLWTVDGKLRLFRKRSPWLAILTCEEEKLQQCYRRIPLEPGRV